MKKITFFTCLVSFICFFAQSAFAFTTTSDFIDNQNGTVTQKTTGLIWQRCSIGQTWNGSTCDVGSSL